MTNIKSGVNPGKVTPVTQVSATPKTPIAASIPAAKASVIYSMFDALPDSAFVRESGLVLSSKRPNKPVPLPFSAPTLWRKVAAGTFPKPFKLSAGMTCWKVSEVRAWMTAQATA